MRKKKLESKKDKKTDGGSSLSAPAKDQKAEPQRDGCFWRLFWCCKPSAPGPPTASPPDQKSQGTPDPKKEEKKDEGSKPPPSPPGDEPARQWLLDPMPEEERKTGKKTLVLDLDETLVHSSFTYIPDADFVIEIELDGAIYKVYVRKRPGVDEFLTEVGKKFEVVIFTASLAKYADPLLDILDKDRIVTKRLFREACVQHYGNYVKDLSLLGRKLEHSIIIDNSPFSYMFQPDNAIPITSWFNDKADKQLYELLPFLDQLLEIEDVTTVLAQKNP